MTLWEIEDNELWGGETPDDDGLLVDYNIEPLDDKGIWLNYRLKSKFLRGKDYIPN